jgi:hypothetical protein
MERVNTFIQLQLKMAAVPASASDSVSHVYLHKLPIFVTQPRAPCCVTLCTSSVHVRIHVYHDIRLYPGLCILDVEPADPAARLCCELSAPGADVSRCPSHEHTHTERIRKDILL